MKTPDALRGGPRRLDPGTSGAAVLAAALLSTFSLNPVLAAEPAAQPAETLDASGMPIPAWQASPELAAEWRRFAGRYIFVRACASCHDWGPGHLSQAEWRSYLAEFPGNHEPDVRLEYGDLTAQFSPGRMVPNREQQADALSTFLLAEAPSEEGSEADEPWDGLPRVGDPVPDFSIVDLEGREHTPEVYRGSRQWLVLVFSRAHW